jgi:hypothetical protein
METVPGDFNGRSGFDCRGVASVEGLVEPCKTIYKFDCSAVAETQASSAVHKLLKYS